MANTNLATQNFGKVNTRFSLVKNILDNQDQVATILQANENMIDYALVQLLENISEYMKTNNRLETAHFLKKVTNHIHQHLSYHNLN